MCNTGMDQRVENYFSSLSYTANRIMADKIAVQNKYGPTWNGLSSDDKWRRIDDALIRAKVNDKYAYYPVSKPDVESFPKLGIRSGEKYVVDEENQQGKGSGNTWRDEHSGPFTWETQSQLDLTFSTESNKKAPPLPSRPPPQDKLVNSKFYKPLPAITKPPVTDMPTPPTQMLETVVNTVVNGKSCAIVPKEKVIGKVAAAVAAANSLKSASPVVPLIPTTTTTTMPTPSVVKNIQEALPREEVIKPRTATVGRKPGAVSMATRCKPPPPPVPVSQQPSKISTVLDQVVLEKSTRGTQQPPPNPPSAPCRHPVNNYGNRASSKTLPTQRRGVSDATVRMAKGSELSSSTNDLSHKGDLSPSSDSDIPKSGFDFLDNW